MAQLLGTPEDYKAIQTELRGVIFKDPMAPDDVESGWQTADGKQKRVLNKKETTLAQQKQQAIKDADIFLTIRVLDPNGNGPYSFLYNLDDYSNPELVQHGIFYL